MALSLRQKIMIASLVPYWIVLFIFAHRPIPEWMYKAEVSDKWLHFLAYLILVFLLWFSISPERKVNWRRAIVWWVVLGLALYGGVDEVVQDYVGRTCDIMDFLANLAGIFAGLVIFSFVTFWPALLVVTAVTVFGLTNLAKANIAELLPVTDAVFHFVAYVCLTLLWIRFMKLYLMLKAGKIGWLMVALGMPLGFLFMVKLSSVILGRYSQPRDILIAASAILVVAGTAQAAAIFRRKGRQV